MDEKKYFPYTMPEHKKELILAGSRINSHAAKYMSNFDFIKAIFERNQPVFFADGGIRNGRNNHSIDVMTWHTVLTHLYGEICSLAYLVGTDILVLVFDKSKEDENRKEILSKI